MFWAFPHIHVRSGYILGAAAIAPLVARRLKRHIVPPQGVTIPNASFAKNYYICEARQPETYIEFIRKLHHIPS